MAGAAVLHSCHHMHQSRLPTMPCTSPASTPRGAGGNGLCCTSLLHTPRCCHPVLSMAVEPPAAPLDLLSLTPSRCVAAVPWEKSGKPFTGKIVHHEEVSRLRQLEVRGCLVEG